MDSHYYHRMNRHWLQQYIGNQQLLYQQMLPANQHLLYRSLQQGLNSSLHAAPQPSCPPVSTSYYGSSSSSPFSEGQTSPSPPSLIALRADSRETTPPSTVIATTVDQPMDLSKPKPRSPAPVKTGTRLVTLLSHNKRKADTAGLDSSQATPLNLSKKTCLPSAISASGSAHPTIVDMENAVNNPVELVQLVNRSQKASKVTQYINQMIYKVFTLKAFTDLHESDRISLVLNCWHRLLLWIYAENKFTFQVTQLQDDTTPKPKLTSSKKSNINRPSMAFVKSVATFLKKYETLRVDSEEMSLLFAITLFHSTGDESYEEPEKISRHRKSLLNQLQQYVEKKSSSTAPASGPGSDKRYIDLLMYLPMLYGVNGKMVEELFCQHLTSDGDIKIALKETIRTFCSRNKSQGLVNSKSR